MRFEPRSYFCTCWKVSPSASASFSWLILSALRRRRTCNPTCTSIGFGVRSSVFTGIATLLSLAGANIGARTTIGRRPAVSPFAIRIGGCHHFFNSVICARPEHAAERDQHQDDERRIAVVVVGRRRQRRGQGRVD